MTMITIGKNCINTVGCPLFGLAAETSGKRAIDGTKEEARWDSGMCNDMKCMGKIGRKEGHNDHETRVRNRNTDKKPSHNMPVMPMKNCLFKFFKSVKITLNSMQ